MNSDLKKKETLTRYQFWGVLLLLLILLTVGLFLFLNLLDSFFPNYPETEVTVQIEEKIIIETGRGYYQYLLRCNFDNGTEILIVLSYYYLSNNNPGDFFSLVASEIDDWITIKISLRNGSYKVIDLVRSD